MLEAENITAKGRHAPLIESTSLHVAPGELLLLRAPEQMTRTALALVLTGRMAPSGGTVTWNGSASRRTLRGVSAVVDAPGINAMERHMRVREYVGEMLSYQPHPLFRRAKPARWLEENDLGDLDNLWDEQLDGEQRIRLMAALARSDQDSELIVWDTPSRHADHSITWIPPLLELARDEERPRAVVAVVPHVSEKWRGPFAISGAGDEETPAPAHARPEDFPDTRELDLNDLFDMDAARAELADEEENH